LHKPPNLIGDEQTGTAVVVDPQRDTDQYIAFAAEYKLKITHVFLTHLHADFVAGHLELRDRVGAAICLGAAAKAAYFRNRVSGKANPTNSQTTALQWFVSSRGDRI
jgi:glyoxylase-like metal-dependent hydrolase (beta-lactamase superfamily II)